MVHLDKLNEDLKTALKAGEADRVSTIRFLLSKINNAKIDKGSELTDEEVMAEVSKEAKRHLESIRAYQEAGRGELVSKEETELSIIKEYLPEPYSDAQMQTMIDEAVRALDAKGIADMGRVVKAVMSSNSGRADGAKVAELVRAKLSTL